MKQKGQKNKSFGSGVFGEWFEDESGLPAYEYTCNQSRDPGARYLTSEGYSIDHWHQVGNSRITLTAHNDGRVELWDASRGFSKFSYLNLDSGIFGGGIALVIEGNEIWSDLHHAKRPESIRRIFGMGYFQKTHHHNGLVLKHTIFPDFGDRPIINANIEVTNTGVNPRQLRILETWDYRPYSLFTSLLSLLYLTPKRKYFGTSPLINLILRTLSQIAGFFRLTAPQVRERFADRFKLSIEENPSNNQIAVTPHFKQRPPKNPCNQAPHNYYPCSMILQQRGQVEKPVRYTRIRKTRYRDRLKYHLMKKLDIEGWATLAVGEEFYLAPGETRTLEFRLVIAPEEEICQYLKENYQEFRENREMWRKGICKFVVNEGDDFSWLTREIKWHSHYLLGAVMYDAYFQRHFLPQGNAYAFLQGLDGSVRDYVLFILPMIFINPTVAREALERIFMATTPEGKLPYAFVNFGELAGAQVHESSTDLYMFLLWAVLEYICLTRDFAFLEQSLALYPKENGSHAPVWQTITRVMEYLIHEVGFGKHDLLNVGSGDWSDGITFFVGLAKRRKFIKAGESVFNSAFLVFVLDKFIPFARNFEHYWGRNFLDQLTKIQQRTREACRATWNGRWCNRAWDGSGHPIGDQNLFLEHHPWILLTNILTPAQNKILLDNIDKHLVQPSTTGHYLLAPPIPLFLDVLPQGWDVNGGIWAAMNCLLIWAYSKKDPKKGWTSILKNSLAQRAENYPGVWYGIWSGADCYNADYAPRPGETFIHPATPQADFPVMNLNVHACFLLGLFKLVGIEADIELVKIQSNFPENLAELETTLVSVKLEPAEIKISYLKPVNEAPKFQVTIPKFQDSWKENLKISQEKVGVLDFQYQSGGVVVFQSRFVQEQSLSFRIQWTEQAEKKN